MSRPVTLVSGQWGDLDLEALCTFAQDTGYDGLELACSGQHVNPRKAVTDAAYRRTLTDTLERHNLRCWALSGHLAGQCVGDCYDPRLDNFAPPAIAGKAEEIRAWGIEEMGYIARAAQLLGCKVVTGFTGSPLWKMWYSFPQTTEKMVDDAFDLIYELWSPLFDEFDRCGVKFALEVHPSEIAFDYYTTKHLLDRFARRETLGINLDPSHLLWQGVNPTLFARDFADRIYHVHVKDVAVTLDGRAGILGSHLAFGDARRGWDFRSPGHGQVDFESLIRALNDCGYSGPLSVEWEDSGMDRCYGARDAREFVRRIDFPKSEIAFDAALSTL